ncbi:PHD finger protein 21A isoform X2 [Nematostella vectensis]|uniref:PHD finger protein 21A isoform X2 n=1 Tax=Nematostella vectensis TaxID=45351 RepID=UPI0020770110|nr:PHD finger protein 21A isoform X2 [Nematostella vectensis]
MEPWKRRSSEYTLEILNFLLNFENRVVQQLRQELLKKSSGIKILPKSEGIPNGDHTSPLKISNIKVKQEPTDDILKPVSRSSNNLLSIKPKPSPVLIMSSQSGTSFIVRCPTSPYQKSSLQSPNMNMVPATNTSPSHAATLVPSSKASGQPLTTNFPTILPRPPSADKIMNKTPKPLEPEKLEFMAALGLITPQTLIDIQAKRQERKRRSNCMSPQNALDIEPDSKRANRMLILPTMKRGRGRPPKFQQSGPASPKTISPLVNGYADNGRANRLRYRRFVTPESPADEDDDHEDACSECKASGELLMCDTCTLVYHLSCLDPPLTTIPTGMWICPKCKETASKSDTVPWPGMLAVVQSYMAHKTAKEEERNTLLKRSEELKAERIELEAKAKSLSNSIMEQMQAKSALTASNKTAKNSVDRLTRFIELVQSL